MPKWPHWQPLDCSPIPGPSWSASRDEPRSARWAPGATSGGLRHSRSNVSHLWTTSARIHRLCIRCRDALIANPRCRMPPRARVRRVERMRRGGEGGTDEGAFAEGHEHVAVREQRRGTDGRGDTYQRPHRRVIGGGGGGGRTIHGCGVDAASLLTSPDAITHLVVACARRIVAASRSRTCGRFGRLLTNFSPVDNFCEDPSLVSTVSGCAFYESSLPDFSSRSLASR